MRTAIDRLQLGKEKEVDIYNFDGYRQKDRFVCPECGEYVFPVTGSRNGFSHYKKKDVECGRRIDGQASCTYYERVGLPLYIQRNNNTFELKIGFSPLNEKLLNLANTKKVQVIVHSGSYYSKSAIFNIDNAGFSSDNTTFKTLDFTPISDNNYKISISDSSLEKQVLEQWSDYADGFTSYGALFSYSETGGKKVRRNDTIEANTIYYWMIPKGYFKAINGIDYKYESSLTLSKKSYDVYSVTMQHQSEREFNDLANFFWDYLRVRLLYIKPEIIPLWPPVIQTEQYSMSLKRNHKNASIFCRVKSHSAEPTVYRYYGKEYSPVPVRGDKTQPKWVNLVLHRFPSPFTVDRKYLANNITLCQKIFTFASDISETLSILPNGDVIPLKSEMLIDKCCKELEIKSSKKIDVICWNKNKPIDVFEVVTDKNMNIILNEKCSDIWIVEKADNNIICKIIRETARKSAYTPAIDDATLFKTINKHIGEPTSLVPREYKRIFHIVKNYPMCYSLLAPNILKGEIQASVLKILIAGGLFNE